MPTVELLVNKWQLKREKKRLRAEITQLERSITDCGVRYDGLPSYSDWRPMLTAQIHKDQALLKFKRAALEDVERQLANL